MGAEVFRPSPSMGRKQFSQDDPYRAGSPFTLQIARLCASAQLLAEMAAYICWIAAFHNIDDAIIKEKCV